MTQNMNRPEKTFRAGLTSVALWKNVAKSKEGNQENTFWTVTLDRRYQASAR